MESRGSDRVGFLTGRPYGNPMEENPAGPREIPRKHTRNAHVGQVIDSHLMNQIFQGRYICMICVICMI